MKTIFTLVILALFPSVSTASESWDDLLGVIENGIGSGAKGDYSAAFAELSRVSLWPKSPKERLLMIEANRAQFDSIQKFGSSDQIVRLSTVHYGKSYCRIRYMDQRAKGGVLWTFICYRKSDEAWYLVSIDIKANEDLAELFSALDSADGIRESN